MVIVVAVVHVVVFVLTTQQPSLLQQLTSILYVSFTVVLKYELHVHDMFAMHTFGVLEIPSNVWALALNFLFGIFEEYDLIANPALF